MLRAVFSGIARNTQDASDHFGPERNLTEPTSCLALRLEKCEVGVTSRFDEDSVSCGRLGALF